MVLPVIAAAALKYGPTAIAALGSLFGGHKAQKRANKLHDRELAQATERWNQGAPLRERGLAGMLSTTRPDLSAQYGGTANPFAVRPRPMAPPPEMAPPPAMDGPLPFDPNGPRPRRGLPSVGRWAKANYDQEMV